MKKFQKWNKILVGYFKLVVHLVFNASRINYCQNSNNKCKMVFMDMLSQLQYTVTIIPLIDMLDFFQVAMFNSSSLITIGLAVTKRSEIKILEKINIFN